MKVKELRNWLSEFGEKHKQHHEDSHRHYLRKTKRQTNPTMVSCEDGEELQQQQGTDPLGTNVLGIGRNSAFDCTAVSTHSDYDDDNDSDAARLKMNGSADMTVSTHDDSTSSNNDSPSRNRTEFYWDATLVSGGSWDEVPFPQPYTTNYQPSFDEDDQTLSVANTDHDDDDDEEIVGIAKEHLALLQKQNQQSKDYLVPTGILHTKESVQGNRYVATRMEPQYDLHNAKILTNQTLTAATLDLICNTNSTKAFLEMASRSLESSSSDDATEEDGDDNEKVKTSSTNMDATKNKSSIVPEVLDSKMARLLLSNGNENDNGDNSTGHYGSDLVQPVPRRKLLNPKDLDFLNPKQAPSPFLEQNKTTSTTTASRRPPSAVCAGIRKFGGPPKKNVERRKEELEKLWMESRSVTHIKKVKWGVCQRSGTYKKKVVIDVQRK